MPSNDELVSLATRIVALNPLGLLTTVDDDGAPHARWMTACAVDGVSRIYTLSARATRKVAHITRHPQVCWVFNSPLHLDVVSLIGRARVDDSPLAIQDVWDHLAASASAYAMGSLSDDTHCGDGLVTIETVVARIEVIIPRLRRFAPQIVDLELV